MISPEAFSSLSDTSTQAIKIEKAWSTSCFIICEGEIIYRTSGALIIDNYLSNIAFFELNLYLNTCKILSIMYYLKLARCLQ